MKNTVENYVTKFNQAYDEYTSSKDSLFPIFCDASTRLPASEFKRFLKGLKADRSTINKLKKICENELVIQNLEKLPASWGTLYVIARATDEQLTTWIENKDITISTTLSQIMKLKNSRRAKPSSIKDKSNQSVVTLTPLNRAIRPQELKDVVYSLSVLEKFFTIEGKEYLTEMVDIHSDEPEVKVAA